MKKHVRMTAIVLCLVLLVAVLLAGCSAEAPATTASQPEEKGQRLHITGTNTDDTYRKSYTVPGTERAVSVFHFDDAAIDVDGQPVLLQKALEEGLVVPEEIAAWARLDALDGFCEMKAESEKGLTTFTYFYTDQFTLKVVNDILESPDGKQHHIETVSIYAPNRTTGSGGAYYGKDGQPLAKEDWGLSFAVEDITPAGFTLVCTQSGGGHQVGALTLESFTLYCVDTESFVHKKDGAIGNAIEGNVVIEQDTTGRVTLDWSETIGELPSGKYAVTVTVLDDFDKETVHPLLVKYQYHQDHTVEFTIP